MSMGMASSSMVLIRIEPLSLNFSTVYGPSHLVLSFPLKSLYLESYNSAQSPGWNYFVLRCRSCHIFLWSWTTFEWMRACILYSSNPFSCSNLSCCAWLTSRYSWAANLNVLYSNSMDSKAFFRRPTHKVWKLLWFSKWCCRLRWPQPSDLPNPFCCCSPP